jgi:hypothetical protein
MCRRLECFRSPNVVFSVNAMAVAESAVKVANVLIPNAVFLRVLRVQSCNKRPADEWYPSIKLQRRFLSEKGLTLIQTIKSDRFVNYN